MRTDLVCAAALLVIAIAYYGLASGLGQSALSDEVGAAGLPMIYAMVLATLGILLALITGLRQRLIRAEPAVTVAKRLGAGHRLYRACGALAIGIAYLMLVPVIGYPFAIALTIGCMAVYQGERLTLPLAGIACTGGAVLFLLFDLVLGIEMPAPWNP